MYKEYPEEFIDELIEKINIVDYIGRYVELKKHNKVLVGLCPLHVENTASFTVFPETNTFYCYGCGKGRSVIDFTMEYQKLSFPEAVESLIKYSGLDPGEIKQQSETIKFLKQFNKKKKIEAIEHQILPEDIMDKYSQQPILEWLWEGISQEVMDKYQIRYDESSNRAVFPIWDNKGNIINIKGRTLYDNYKDLGIKKYIYYYKLGSNDFLYPLYFKKKNIKEKNEVIVTEGSKSIWKLEGWNIHNAISLETSHINEYQLKLLLELRCNIVIALDKGIFIDKIKEQCSQLIKFTNVFVIYDTKEILNNKDAPCDQNFKVWEYLYNNKIKL